MASINNISTPGVLNRAFVQLAIEAGIATTIKSLVPLGMDEKTLLIALVDALEADNPELAEVFANGGLMTLRKVLEALAADGDGDGDVAATVSVYNLPTHIAASEQTGPASVTAGRDGSDNTQLNVGWTTPPEGYVAELYLDMVFMKTSTQGDSGGTTFDVLNEVDGNPHVFRVLYRREADGALTGFGPLVNVAGV